jgi:hypothetical protein
MLFPGITGMAGAERCVVVQGPPNGFNIGRQHRLRPKR